MKSLCAVLVLSSAILGGCQSTTVVDDRPNILIVVIDDMGYSDLGAFGSEIRTPRLDELAASGVRFTNFYVGPTCSPTRSMLLTGNDNHVAGLGTMSELMAPNQVGQPGYEGHLNDHVVSFATVLQDAGYRTYMAGKWHLGEEPETDPSRRGFEKSFTMLQGGASHFDDEWMMSANYTPTYRENGVRVHVPRGFYSTEFYTDKIMTYLETQDDDAPFLAYLSFTAVHDPLHLPEGWANRYDGHYDAGFDAVREQRLRRMKELGIVPERTQPASWLPFVPKWDDLDAEQQKLESRRMEIYAGMVETVDLHVGRLLDYLETIGERDNTLVIVFSDNGANGLEMHQYPETDEAWVERNSDNRFENLGHRGSRVAEGPGWAQVSSTPFRLFKAFLAEGGIRSPLIMSGPGIESTGEPNHAVTHVMDIAPTLFEYAGTAYPATHEGRSVAPIRGVSMVPILSGERDGIHAADEPIAWEFNNGRAIRIGHWKATWIAAPFGPDAWQLYNVAEDPGETVDLAGQHPDILGRLITAWEAYAADVGVIPPSVAASADG